MSRKAPVTLVSGRESQERPEGPKAMRGLRCVLTLASLLLVAPATAAEPIVVNSTPITTFKSAAIGAPVDGLVFRGGHVLRSPHPEFGGLSGLSFLDATRFVMVTDEGRFLSGSLSSDGISDVQIDIIRNSGGQPLPSKFSSDSEAVEVIVRNGSPSAVRVGFEHLTRIADFDLINGRPGGPARPVPIPDWMTALRHNDSIESICIAPPASPIAGSTLIITEGHSLRDGTWAATLLGVRDRGDLHLARSGQFNPTDCAFLPDGDLLVLERSLSLLTFSMQIRRIEARDVQPGATMDGDIILSAAGSEIDNMEGLGVRTIAGGEVRITIVSDDNFNSFQRNLLLEFALP